MVVALQLIMNWCRRVGLNANPNKTTLVPFTNRRKLCTEPILVENQPIPYSGEVKNLGVILDSKLNWGAHLEHITKKATKAIWVCSSYCGRTWGVSPELMLSIYQSTVRPILTYAAWIWWRKVDQKTTQEKLNKLQRLACLSISGAIRTCPTAALESIFGLTPLHLHIKGTAASSALKYACLNKSTETAGHMCIIQNIPKWEYLVQCTDCVLNEQDFEKPFGITILKGDSWTWRTSSLRLTPQFGTPMDPRPMKALVVGSTAQTHEYQLV